MLIYIISLSVIIIVWKNQKDNNKMHESQSYQGGFDEHKKIFCAYHKTQFLTNFCVHKNCLMPLCPSCIVDHTQQHYQQSTKSLYMNLYDALSNAKQTCLDHIHNFEDYSNKIQQISQFKKRLIHQVHNQLLQHKQNIFIFIQKIFLQFEHEVYQTITNNYNTQGLYCQNYINQYQLKIQNTINQLYNTVGILKSDQCLAGLIMFYGQNKFIFNQIQQSCHHFIDKHQSLNIDTILDQNKMKQQLSNLFNNVVQIKKVLGCPVVKYQPIQSKTPQKIRINNSASNSRKSKLVHQIDSKNYSPAKAHVSASNKRDSRGKFDSSFHVI